MPGERQSSELFPSFFLGGFECSSQIDRSGERQDLLALTQHDRQYWQDYELVRSVGIRVVRDGLRWDLCDQCGHYDFRSVAPKIRAARELGLVQLWDLFHYGYPDDLDPWQPAFIRRFGDFAHAFARWLSRRADAPRFYVPVNEPSFFAWAAGEVAWFAPFGRGRGFDLKLQLAQAAIAGVNAIRAADPSARIVNPDPVCHVVPPADAPELTQDAAQFNTFQWQTWDILVGKEWPQFGGSPEHLDIVGVNYYPHNQWEHCREGCLALDDPRRKPFREILLDVHGRYQRPIVVTETASCGDLRPIWLHQMVRECMAAARRGVDLQGICLYPIIDMPGWHGGLCGDFLQYGLWDVVPEGDRLRRVIYKPYLRTLQRAQRRVETFRSALPAKRMVA